MEQDQMFTVLILVVTIPVMQGEGVLALEALSIGGTASCLLPPAWCTKRRGPLQRHVMLAILAVSLPERIAWMRAALDLAMTLGVDRCWETSALFAGRRLGKAPGCARLRGNIALGDPASRWVRMAELGPTMRALAQLVESRRRLVGDTVRLTNRLTSALKNSFPQVLQWFDEQDTPLFGDVLSRWPTLKAAQRARRSTLEAFFRAHHVRSAALIASRLQAIKSASALTTDEGIVTPNALLVHALVAQLRVTLRVIADFDTAIAQHAQGHPDFPLFDAWPGAGAVFAPRLLVAFGEQRERSTSADDL